MQLSSAVTAGQLAAQINDLQAIVSDFAAFLADQAIISGQVSVADPVNGNRLLSFPSLTAAESAILFQGAQQIFQARLNALSAQLANLT